MTQSSKALVEVPSTVKVLVRLNVPSSSAVPLAAWRHAYTMSNTVCCIGSMRPRQADAGHDDGVQSCVAPSL